MNLADRLAAARESRGDGDLEQDDLPDADEAQPEVRPRRPRAGLARSRPPSRPPTPPTRGGKRRADVPASRRLRAPAARRQPGSSPTRSTTAAPEPVDRDAGFVSTAKSDRIEELKSSVHVQLLQQMGPHLYDSDMDQNELDTEVRKVLADVLGSQDRPLSSSDRARVTQEISDDILGYGPIEPYLRDPDVSEVMVNGHNSVWLEKSRPADAGRRALHRRGAPAPHDRQDRVADRPPRRRVEPDGGRPPPRRQPCQRRRPAARGGRLGADHPEVRRPTRSRSRT